MRRAIDRGYYVAPTLAARPGGEELLGMWAAAFAR